MKSIMLIFFGGLLFISRTDGYIISHSPRIVSHNFFKDNLRTGPNASFREIIFNMLESEITRYKDKFYTIRYTNCYKNNEKSVTIR